MRQHMRLERRLPILRYWRWHRGNDWNVFRFLAICCACHTTQQRFTWPFSMSESLCKGRLYRHHTFVKDAFEVRFRWPSLVLSKAPYVSNSYSFEKRLLGPDYLADEWMFREICRSTLCCAVKNYFLEKKARHDRIPLTWKSVGTCYRNPAKMCSIIQCYCGLSTDQYWRLDEDRCDVQCEGDPTEICGGDSEILAYEYSTVSSTSGNVIGQWPTKRAKDSKPSTDSCFRVLALVLGLTKLFYSNYMTRCRLLNDRRLSLNKTNSRTHPLVYVAIFGSLLKPLA